MRTVWGGLAKGHKRNKILQRGVCGPDHSATENSRCCTAAAKSLQQCQTLCNPIDGRPPGSPIPGILQARALEWVAISFSNA